VRIDLRLANLLNIKRMPVIAREEIEAIRREEVQPALRQNGRR
jgi:hypothetical protein